MHSPGWFFTALERRTVRRALFAVVATLFATSMIWDDRTVGEVAHELFSLGLIVFIWLVLPRRSRWIRVAFVVALAGSIVQLGYAIAGSNGPIVVQLATTSALLCAIVLVLMGLRASQVTRRAERQA